MAKQTQKSANMGKTKRSTDDLIDDAIASQNSWMENRRAFARRFLKTLNIFARPSEKSVSTATNTSRQARTGLRAYWFPILCALFVIFVAIWAAFIHTTTPRTVVVVPTVPEPVVQPVAQVEIPTFDIVRIEPAGNIIIAGRWLAHQNLSIIMNGKMVATERTDSNGEFVYSPSHALAAGNYTISLLGSEPAVKSDENVFVYVSPNGYKNSVSLLMTRDGSTLLQAPSQLADGDLTVSKIDYLDTGRIVVTGDALPRLRVSLALDNKYLGFARVSDHKHFGLGADVGKLNPGDEYTLTIRLHDGDGRTIAQIGHTFVMPEMTGDDDTFYTVRRGDCLWVIARNFLRRGILFSIIAERNNIENPNLIFPKQLLQIPVGGK